MLNNQEGPETNTQEAMEDFDIKVRELELKYSKDDVKLTEFNKFAWDLIPVKYLEVSSWDHYYGYLGKDKDNQVEFIRYRDGVKPELTIKMKTDEKNNNDRVEVDVPLEPNMNHEDRKHFVEEFCKSLNFELNFSRYKYCSIFFYEKVDIVYYITFDPEMKEKGRFLEIEARKDYPFASKEDAWKEVEEMEKKFSVFGITPQHRMKKSQWQLGKKS